MSGEDGLLAGIPQEIGRAQHRWVVGRGLVSFSHYGMDAAEVAQRTLDGMTDAQRATFWRVTEDVATRGAEARVTATEAPGAPLTLDLPERRVIVQADGEVVDAGPAVWPSPFEIGGLG